MGARNPEIDLGLAVSGALLPPGQTRTITEIAAYCGCSKQNIEQLENKALRKLRNKVLFSPDLRDELGTFLAGSDPTFQLNDAKRRTHHPVI